MAKLTKAQLAEVKEELKQQAEIQKKIAESAGDYLKLIKEIKVLQKNLSQIKKSVNEQELKYQKALNEHAILQTAASEEALNIEKEKLKILKKEQDILEKNTAMLVRAAKETNAFTKSFAVIKDVNKDFLTIKNTITKSYATAKNWTGLFSMDKALRMSTLSMGILSKQTAGFRANIKNASNSTIDFGMGIEEISKLQSDYSQELGRSVILSEKGLIAMGEMAVATGLGAEGTAKFAADMDNVGYSAERTKDFVEQTMNDSHKLGLNASKVVKNISANIKMLNKYNFKGGAKGLAKMAETATKLGVDMNMVSGMADKLFDIEGAVDMSAQLQVMGGEWSKLADPFKLMYMARNDMEGLMEAVGKAAEASVTFNSKTKEFEISAMEMHRLRKISEQTGVAYEDLAQAAKNAAKATKIKSQFSFDGDKELEEFVGAMGQFDDKGQAYIDIGDGKGKQLLKDLNISKLREIQAEETSLKKRAEISQTFDEKLGNLVRQFKQLLLPLLESLDEGLRPVAQKFADAMRNPDVIKAITSAAIIAGKAIAMVGKFIANNPLTALAAFGLFELGKWVLNGRALGMGFNSVASVGGGASSSGGNYSSGGFKNFRDNYKGLRAAGDTRIGAAKSAFKWGGGFKGVGRSLLKGVGGGLALAGLGMGADAWRGNLDDPNSTGGKWLGVGGTAASWAGTGAMIGSIIPGLGTLAGGIIGGVAGAIKGAYDEFFSDTEESTQTPQLEAGRPLNDFASYGKNKNDFSKGNKLIQGGKIHPIDNKDSFIGMKPKGPVDNVLNSNNIPSTTKIEFGELKINFGEIIVKSPGNPETAKLMLRDEHFMRDLTNKVQAEIKKVLNQGKNKG